MSDDEYMQDDEYGFEYSDDDGDDQADASLENRYYTAKSMKEDDPEAAIVEFKSIVEDEPEKSDWGFKALKQQTKLNFLVLNQPSEALKTYTKLLSYTKSAVTRNYSEKTINGILDYVSGSGKKRRYKSKGGKKVSEEEQMEVLEKFYEVTRKALEEAKNERLSVKTNLKLAKLYLDKHEYPRLQALLRSLHESTLSATAAAPTGADDSTAQSATGTLLLEIYALEIQMYSDMRDYKKLKEIYNASSQVRSAIPHPRIMGVIRECGGKMWMGERQWAKASSDFFESFRSYDEAGSPQRIQVLKYLVLANMLTGAEVNPFDSQETKPYKNDPEITAMTDLVSAYQRREVHEAEKILRENKATIMDDAFIRSYMGDVLRSLRTHYLIDLMKPYTRLEIGFLAKQLNVDNAEVEELCIGLILDGKVQGRIDQVAQIVELERHKGTDARRYNALDAWAGGMQKIFDNIVAKAGATNERGMGGMAMGMGMGMPFGGGEWEGSSRGLGTVGA
ncbi:PCI-domain-containing protein [Calocera viscosa TUFC12733]|uniref:COP9 signalosome complex subunit 2 n=1 Tax=Calocera viscosa (strain TUFC12733) TaxID=1330018 RepID=A0A167FNT3_CALVF|nr:PCI-domain-containing protein [Calocera viscosa TUFC12733]